MCHRSSYLIPLNQQGWKALIFCVVASCPEPIKYRVGEEVAGVASSGFPQEPD